MQIVNHYQQAQFDDSYPLIMTDKQATTAYLNTLKILFDYIGDIKILRLRFDVLIIHITSIIFLFLFIMSKMITKQKAIK